MLKASLATRRTFVRRRVTADNANALSALGLFILRIFSYPQNGAVKKLSFFYSPVAFIYCILYRFVGDNAAFFQKHFRPFGIFTRDNRKVL